MKNFLIFFLILVTYAASSFARYDDGSGFYMGVNPEKTNSKIGNADNSVSLDSKVAEDRYYGYKFSSGGFFVAPEVFMQNGGNLNTTQNAASNTSTTTSSTTTANSSAAKSNQIGSIPGMTYSVKANVGYEFNHYVSGFVTYDLGSFAYSSNGRGQQVTIGSNRANSSAVGIGSQINLSNRFGVKIMYTQQQFENSSVVGGRIRSDVVKLGTVYSF